MTTDECMDIIHTYLNKQVFRSPFCMADSWFYASFMKKEKTIIRCFWLLFPSQPFVHPLLSHVFFQFESFVIMIDEGQSFIHTQLGRLGFSLIAAYSVHLFGLFLTKGPPDGRVALLIYIFKKGIIYPIFYWNEKLWFLCWGQI